MSHCQHTSIHKPISKTKQYYRAKQASQNCLLVNHTILNGVQSLSRSKQLLGFGSRQVHLKTVHRLGLDSCVVKVVPGYCCLGRVLELLWGRSKLWNMSLLHYIKLLTGLLCCSCCFCRVWCVWWALLLEVVLRWHCRAACTRSVCFENAEVGVLDTILYAEDDIGSLTCLMILVYAAHVHEGKTGSNVHFY